VNRILALLVAFVCGSISLAQSDKPKLELFAELLGRTTPPSAAYIPLETCSVIIKQAEKILDSDQLKAIAKHDLQVASLNLRTCAALKLSRIDRDLAVGIYGEMRVELECRRTAEK